MKLESSVIMRVWVLEGLDAVLDVGGVYDPSRDRYDHHQKGFGEVFGHGFSTKLSSAGLVFKQFGKEIIKELKSKDYVGFVNSLVDNFGHEHVVRFVVFPFKNTLFYLLQATDAIDNGINQYDMDQPPRYVNSTHLSSRVGKLNLDWTDPDQSSKKENEAFERAMALAGSEFLDSVRFHARSWLPARSIVMECLSAGFDVDPSAFDLGEQNIERWVLLEYRRCFRLELGSGGILTTMIHFAERLQSKATRTYTKRIGKFKDGLKYRSVLSRPWVT
ncbi:hypothetical protein NC651_000919 [Populus alba x Populus x berolinensis]|nr:hypothetical protein NC651_000919 [Populus alba x Populus x berolinensis]